MKLGASTIPFRGELLTREVLARFSEAGIESLELCDYHPNFDFADSGFRAFLRQSLGDMGFHLNSIHIHLKHRDPACDLASLDPAGRRKALDGHRQAVDLAADLGGCILVTHDIAIPEPEEELGLEKRAAFLQNLWEVAGYAAPAGVRLALENTGPSGYTGHRNLGGDPAAALRTVGRHLITLHLHDNRGEQDEHLLPGRGNIAWDEVKKALSDVGYDGVFMYEISRPEDLPELAENAAWIQGL